MLRLRLNYILALLYAIALLWQPQLLYAQEGRVYLPVILHADGKTFGMSAYFTMIETKYGIAWKDFVKNYQSKDEVALIKILQAKFNRDLNYVKQVVDKEVYKKDPGKFQKRMNNSFHLWPSIKHIRVGRKFKYDDNVVFVLEGYWKSKSRARALRPSLRFRYERDGSLAYVPPYGREDVGDLLLSFWRNDAAKTPNAVEPRSLDQWIKDPRGVAYRHKFGSGDGLAEPVSIVFEGIRAKSEAADKNDVFAFYRNMQKLLSENRHGEFLSNYTEESSEYVRYSVESTSDSTRKYFTGRFVAQEPIFLIKADPTYVLYTQVAQSIGVVEITYIIRRPGKGYAITNAGSAMLIDRIFKGKAFSNAALEETPFWSMEVVGGWKALFSGG